MTPNSPPRPEGNAPESAQESTERRLASPSIGTPDGKALVLALETSADPWGLALADEGGVAASLAERHRMRLSAVWAERLQEMLERNGLSVTDLRGLAVCLGPGSFTGLRVGVVAAKTLGQALGLPVVGISSLELMALPLRSAAGLRIAAVLPCRKGEVYAAFYQATGAGLEPLSEPTVLPVEQFLQQLAGEGQPTVFCGRTGQEDIPLPANALDAGPACARPSVELLAVEGRNRLLAGQGEDPRTLLPLYLKRSQAEEKAMER